MLKQKLFLGAAIIGFSQMALADMISDFEMGPVIGIQGGYGRAAEGNGLDQWTNNIMSTYNGASRKVSQWGFAGRGYLGFNFSPYLGLEAGFQYYPRDAYKASGSSVSATQSLNMHVDSYAFDLMAKLTLPLVAVSDEFDGYSLFIRGGAAYVTTKVHGSYGGIYYGTPTTPVQSFNYSQTNHSFRPAYGAGLSYNFNDNFAAEVAWTGIYGKNRLSYVNAPLSSANPSPTLQITNANKVVPFGNMFTLGLSYKFTGVE